MIHILLLKIFDKTNKNIFLDTTIRSSLKKMFKFQTHHKNKLISAASRCIPDQWSYTIPSNINNALLKRYLIKDYGNIGNGYHKSFPIRLGYCKTLWDFLEFILWETVLDALYEKYVKSKIVWINWCWRLQLLCKIYLVIVVQHLLYQYELQALIYVLIVDYNYFLLRL